MVKADYGVPLPTLVVFLRVVEIEMKASAFTPLESANNDQLSHSGQISQFDEITVQAYIGVMFVDFSLYLGQVILGKS